MRLSDFAQRLVTVSLCLAVLASVLAAPVAATGTPTPVILQAESPGGDTNESSNESGNTTTPSAEGGGPSVSGEVVDGSTTDGIAGGSASDIAGNESGNATGNESGPGAGAGLGGGGMLGSVGPDPAEWAIDLLSGLVNLAIENHESGIDRFHEEGIGIPAPGDADDRSTWTTDVTADFDSMGDDMDGVWSGAVPAHFVAGFIGIVWLLIQFLNASTKGPKERRDMYQRQGIAFLMIVGGHHLFAPLVLHSFNEAALQLAPAGEDFTGSFGNLARLGIGLIFAVILLTLSSFTFVLGLISVELTNALIYIIYGAWGLMWAGWASSGQARALGQQGIFTLGALLALAPLQALILFMIFRISWTGGLGSPLSVLLGTCAGLAIAFIYLPWTFLKQTVLSAAAALGTGAALASTQIDAALENYVFEREDQYEEENDTTHEDRPSTGRVQSAGSGSGYTVADGGSTGTPDAASWGSPPRDANGRFVSPSEYDRQEQDRINHNYD